MRRTLLPAVLLVLSTVTSACAHESPDAATASPDASEVPEAGAEAGPEAGVDAEAEPEDEAELEDASAELLPAAGDPNVISFEDDVTAGPVDAVVAPPKREDIPSFALFGTGESMDHDGPKLTLPDDAE